MHQVHKIKVTVFFEAPFWIGFFERTDTKVFSAAKKVFGSEPTDPELYYFVMHHFDELNFTKPCQFELIIKRKNPKRIARDVRKQMKKLKEACRPETYAEEVLRLAQEENKKTRKRQSKAEKEALQQEKFRIKQEKKKKKHRGH